MKNQSKLYLTLINISVPMIIQVHSDYYVFDKARKRVDKVNTLLKSMLRQKKNFLSQSSELKTMEKSNSSAHKKMDLSFNRRNA